MILLAVKFTSGKLSHTEEHEIGCDLRDRLLETVCPGEKCEIALMDGGKPYIVGSDLSYSISHTAGCVACALMGPALQSLSEIPPLSDEIQSERIYKISDTLQGSAIGLDVELVDRSKPEGRLAGIAGRFFTEGERELFNSAEDKHTAFYRIWTGKESIIKCSGEGMSGIERADTLDEEKKCRITGFSIAKNGEKFESSICVDTI